MTQFNNHQQGRSDLESWNQAQPKNFFEADVHFQRVLSLYASNDRFDELCQELSRFGAEVATYVDELARKNNENLNLPKLQRWSDYGTRIEKIDHHPTYHEAGRYIYGSGVMAAYAEHPNAIGALSRFFISSFCGEAGHNCPLACTAGVIRVLQELGSKELKDRYLPGLLNRDYSEHLEGAQFLTEIQGGSDVGANSIRAVANDDGTWNIFGEKWFCSNIDADIFLMTARFEDAPKGTQGLGLFLVPRLLDDGTVNEFYIRRLKNKLGTRSMASGECDFHGAQAYHMGELDEGFKNMMKLVINTSRLYNAVGVCGVARRAQIIAQTYAQHRHAFGKPIVQYPLVQETLANLKAEVDAMISGTFYLAALQDRLDANQTTPVEQQFFRMALNINKSLTARSGRWAVVESIEILGGNGAIEDFSILPRLLRDSIVYENWEGTHNTLYMQVLRDMHRYRVHEGFLAHLQAMINQPGPHTDSELVDELNALIESAHIQINEVLSLDSDKASLRMRSLNDHLSYLMYACVRAFERQQSSENNARDRDSLEHFLDLRLRATRKSTEDEYLQRISTLATGI